MKKLAAIAAVLSLSLSMLSGCGNESAASSQEATAENPMVAEKICARTIRLEEINTREE